MTVMDRLRLEDKVVVVTGASKNLGLEVARACAEAGATVVMVARGADLLEQRRTEIEEETGQRIIGLVGDVSNKASVTDLVDTVHAEFPQVDALVNNAAAHGGTHGTPVLEIADRPWEETFYANVMGPYWLISGFGKPMLAGRGGSIINVLSGSGFLPTPHATPYGATKSALWMMTRYMSQELAPKIRVNALIPGLTMSDTGGPREGPATEYMTTLVPMGRAGHPREVAPAAVYLASDASSYTNGTALFVNGGRLW
jgi:NAD(P)-dependent dehydrogenase (short-subunit alcohol dehydrogenase family)